MCSDHILTTTYALRSLAMAHGSCSLEEKTENM